MKRVVFAREEAYKAIVRADFIDKVRKYSGPGSEWSEFGGVQNIPGQGPLPEEGLLDPGGVQNPWNRDEPSANSPGNQ